MSLDEERVALGVEPFGETVRERNHAPLVLAEERRDFVERSGSGDVEAAAPVVAPPEKRASFARRFRHFVPGEDALAARLVEPPANAADLVAPAPDELDARVVCTVRRN